MKNSFVGRLDVYREYLYFFNPLQILGEG